MLNLPGFNIGDMDVVARQRKSSPVQTLTSCTMTHDIVFCSKFCLSSSRYFDGMHWSLPIHKIKKEKKVCYSLIKSNPLEVLYGIVLHAFHE